MRHVIIFSQLASEDLTETLGWYKEQKDGLEKQFITEMPARQGSSFYIQPQTKERHRWVLSPDRTLL